MKLIDMTGQRVGRLLVLRKSEVPRMWLCRCDCGTEKLVTGPNLRQHVRSCGCLAKEWAAHLGGNPDYIEKRAESAVKHGHKRRSGKSPEYKTWLGMKRRCFDARCKDYPNWGGRGITVCPAWRDSFSQFLSDMGPKPEGGTIDRIDPNGHYEPGNCRWATVQQQGAEHRRSLRPITVLGQDFPTLLAAAKHFGINPSKVRQRLEAGIPVDRAFDNSRLQPRRTRESYLPRTKR